MLYCCCILLSSRSSARRRGRATGVTPGSGTCSSGKAQLACWHSHQPTCKCFHVCVLCRADNPKIFICAAGVQPMPLAVLQQPISRSLPPAAYTCQVCVLRLHGSAPLLHRAHATHLVADVVQREPAAAGNGVQVQPRHRLVRQGHTIEGHVAPADIVPAQTTHTVQQQRWRLYSKPIWHVALREGCRHAPLLTPAWHRVTFHQW